MSHSPQGWDASSGLDGLRLGRALGGGAASEVRLATARGSGAVYALKAVRKAAIVGRAQLARLMREKAIQSALADRAVVRLHATLQDEARLYLLLELAPGGELLWHLRRQRPPLRLPEPAARVVLAQLLLPLQRLWAEHTVLHRDLKPTNILFCAAGRLKLADFGHAKRLGAPDERSYSTVGTPHFASPEAVGGRGHGAPAQLWALGVLLFEALAGEPPFAHADCSAAELRRRIVEDEPPLHKLRAAGASEGARDLVGRLLLRREAERAAAFPCGFAAVRADGWFDGLDWAAVDAGALVPPGLDFGAHAALVLGEGGGGQSESGLPKQPAAVGDPFDDF